MLYKTTLYKTILSEQQRLAQEIASLRGKISTFPDGKLVCTTNRGYTKWYQSDGHHSTYIPKRNRKLAEQLAIKKYLSLQLQALLQEQNALASYLHHHVDSSEEIHQLLSPDSPYSDLLSPYFTPASQELIEWAAQPYNQNTTYPDQLIHKTSAGILVRSKSEALITTLLHINKIPFRYECALTLENVTLYPDFTIRHPQTGQTFYWEHFGLMDNPSYSQNAFSKLQLYNASGICPSAQLITTYESKDSPLDSTLVTNLIRFYFL